LNLSLAWPHVTHLGFTGTRQGMTHEQLRGLGEILAQTVGATTFHHGDCVGSDAQAHALAQKWGISCIVHPPRDLRFRAWCEGHIIEVPLEYLERNRAIVEACDVLIAAPRTCEEEQRSGTWSTVRYARKLGRPIVFLMP